MGAAMAIVTWANMAEYRLVKKTAGLRLQQPSHLAKKLRGYHSRYFGGHHSHQFLQWSVDESPKT